MKLRWLPCASLLFACGPRAATGADGGVCLAAQYPCAPYGYAAGTVIADLNILGQRDTNGDGTATDQPVQPIRLADYFADKQLAALAIVIGTVGCVPCQNEQPSLLELNAQYQPGGRVVFLEAIVQDGAGAPADTQVIDDWAVHFGLPFDITADPTQALAPYYNANSFPSAMVIRLADMMIVYQVTGPADGFKSTIDRILSAQ